MNLDLTILRLASELAAHAKTRQSVIAENVAHADTPGYRARDVVDFAAVIDADVTFAARATRPGHMEFAGGANGYAVEETAAFGAASPNGNTVSLEDQMVRAADTRSAHGLALGVYGKTLDILRAGLGR